jgi:uncharacterized protein (DUF4415 family)
MSDRRLPPPADLDENPEWTAKDFAKAKPGRDLPADILAVFPKTKRGRPPVEHPKVPVSIRLSAEVVEFFKADGPGWHTRIDQELQRVMASELKKRKANAR